MAPNTIEYSYPQDTNACLTIAKKTKYTAKKSKLLSKLPAQHRIQVSSRHRNILTQLLSANQLNIEQYILSEGFAPRNACGTKPCFCYISSLSIRLVSRNPEMRAGIERTIINYLDLQENSQTIPAGTHLKQHSA